MHIFFILEIRQLVQLGVFKKKFTARIVQRKGLDVLERTNASCLYVGRLVGDR